MLAHYRRPQACEEKRQHLFLKLHHQIGEHHFGRLQRQAHVDGFLIDLRIAQLQDDGVGLDDGA